MVCRRRCGAALLLVVLGLCGFASFHSLSSSDACACSPSTATGEAGEGCERRAGTGGHGVCTEGGDGCHALFPARLCREPTRRVEKDGQRWTR